MSDINMEDIERNSPVVIPPTQEQQQQQQQQPILITSRSTNVNAGGSGQATKNRLKALLTLRTPQPVEAAPSNNNNVQAASFLSFVSPIPHSGTKLVSDPHFCLRVGQHNDSCITSIIGSVSTL